jgi:hypothetical protein
MYLTVPIEGPVVRRLFLGYFGRAEIVQRDPAILADVGGSRLVIAVDRHSWMASRFLLCTLTMILSAHGWELPRRLWSR